MPNLRLPPLLACAITSLAAPAAAQDTAPPRALTVSGGATLVSDYRFRGVSQSDGGPAAQATLALDHVSGAYAVVSADTIDGAGRIPARSGYGRAELDVSAGYAKLVHGFTLDGGLAYFAFPDADRGRHTDYFEPYASIGYTIGPIAAKLGANYAWGGQRGLAVFAGGRRDDDLYVHGETSFAVPRTPLTLKAHAGHAAGALAHVNPDPAHHDYWDWSATAEAIGGPIRVGVTYADTDITERGAFARRAGRGSTVIGYVGLSF